MEMKLNLKVVSFVRLGLCIAGAIILSQFLTFAVKHQLNYIHPLGVLFVLGYTLMVVYGFKKVYPEAIKAVGHLCFTFLFVALNGLNQYKKAIESVVPAEEMIAQNLIISEVYFTQSKVAIQAVFILLAVYITLRIMRWRKSKAGDKTVSSSNQQDGLK